MSPFEIDRAILTRCRDEWRKVAWIIADIIHAADDPPDPHAVGGRIAALVRSGRLEAQGNLTNWRHSEIRLPVTSRP